MGVKGAWEISSPAAEDRSFLELSVTDGFRGKPGTGGLQLLKVGVDSSLWMHAVCSPFHHNHAGAGENPELRALFYRLTGLSKLPIHAHFVFDGDNRPASKRGTLVRKTPHYLTAGFQELISAFGFTWHMAPGEAEAELAYLNILSKIDVVATEDSDALVFGAPCVVRNFKSEDKAYPVQVYTTDALLNGVNMTRGGLLLMALLAGGDYDRAGLAGCGAMTAYRLNRYGLGDSLLHAVETLPVPKLPSYFTKWRNELRNILRTNPCDHLGHRHIMLSESVPDTFPDLDVICKYIAPITSWSEGQESYLRTIPQIVSHQLNITQLTSICERRFGWDLATIKDKFRRLLWAGACVRAMCQMPPPENGNNFVPTFRILKRTSLHKANDLLMYRINLTGTPLIAATQMGFHGGQQSPSATSDDPTDCLIHIPALVLEHAFPEVANMFCEQHHMLPASCGAAAVQLTETAQTADEVQIGDDPEDSMSVIDLTDDSADNDIIDLT